MLFVEILRMALCLDPELYLALDRGTDMLFVEILRMALCLDPKLYLALDRGTDA